MTEKKRKLLSNVLAKIITRKKNHLKKTNQLRRRNNATEVVIAGSGALATTTLILSMSGVGAPLLIASTVFSTIATVGTAMKRASNVKSKYESHKSSYLAYSGLEREVKFMMTHPEWTDNQYDTFFTDLNNRLDLIEDNSITIDSESSNRGATDSMSLVEI